MIRRCRPRLLITSLLGFACCVNGSAFPPAGPSLRLVQTIALEGVEGRIDHMATDPRGRLFVAALGNGTVEVVDLHLARRVKTLRGLREPQGVGFVASPPRLFVSNGGDGTCDVLDGGTFSRLRKVRLSGDADNIRVDPGGRRVYVGYGSGALRVLDAATGDSLDDLPLPGHPESFEIEARGARAFVNVPDAGEVAIVDRATGRPAGKVMLGGFGANYPMALDEAGHRLFVGCRRPPAVLVFDERSGKRVANVPIDGDVDDLFYDPTTRRLFASCGAGFIDVMAPEASGRFARAARIATAPGARTALYEPAVRRLYLAVPRRGPRPAEIRVYECDKE